MLSAFNSVVDFSSLCFSFTVLVGLLLLVVCVCVMFLLGYFGGGIVVRRVWDLVFVAAIGWLVFTFRLGDSLMFCLLLVLGVVGLFVCVRLFCFVGWFIVALGLSWLIVCLGVSFG